MDTNIYTLPSFRPNDGGKDQQIAFYELETDGKWKDGTTLEELLTVAITRLSILNNKFPCRENSIAITKIQEALLWLEERTKDRIKRGVEGKHLA